VFNAGESSPVHMRSCYDHHHSQFTPTAHLSLFHRKSDAKRFFTIHWTNTSWSEKSRPINDRV